MDAANWLNLNLVALGTTAIAAISLGIAVYQRMPDRVWNRLFAIHATGGGLWTFTNYMIMSADDAATAGIWLRLSHPVVAMLICTCVDFAWVFPERIEYANTKRRMILYAIGLIAGTVGFAPNLYYSIEIGQGIVNVEYGWPLIPFGVFVLGTLGYADFVLLRKAIRLEGVQRVQVIWVLLGLLGTHLVGSLTIIIIPLVWGTTALSGWGTAGYIITLIGMGYAIAKHRLMRPEVALRRVASAMLSTALVLFVGIGALETIRPLLVAGDVPLRLAYVAAGLLMGMLIVLLHERVTGFLRRTLSKGADADTVQAETSSHILRTLDADQLLRYLGRALAEALEPTEVAVYTGDPSQDQLIPRAWVNGERHGEAEWDRPRPIDMGNQILVLAAREGTVITRDHVFRFASLDEAKRLALLMDELNAQIVAPMIWEDRLVGVLTLGPKRSGDMYTEEDLRFVAHMALQSSLALRNAELYAQTASLKDFNERILRQMDNAVVVTDADERIVVFNRAAERLFGTPAAEALGQSIEVLPEGIATCIRASLGSGRILSSRHFEMERGAETIPLACSTSPLADDRGGPQGAVAVISDLTLIQELARERQEAERLSLIRVISAGMAHEIRNPLVAIRTFAELAPKRLDDPEFRSNFLTVAQQEIRRIDKLVGDLLTLSKPADAVVESVNVNQVCGDVVRAVAGMAEAKGIDVSLSTTDAEPHATGDGSRLHQALLNIVSNAIAAEPRDGRVSIATETEGEEGAARIVRVRVHNPGSYIPPEQTDEIFRPFVSKKSSGTGLGLAICQTIIEEHNGRVKVHSSPDEGTEFSMELPLTSTAKPMRTVGDW